MGLFKDAVSSVKKFDKKARAGFSNPQQNYTGKDWLGSILTGSTMEAGFATKEAYNKAAKAAGIKETDKQKRDREAAEASIVEAANEQQVILDIQKSNTEGQLEREKEEARARRKRRIVGKRSLLFGGSTQGVDANANKLGGM